MQVYPQLLDQVNTSGMRGTGSYNALFDKYKVKELSGSIKEKSDEYAAQVKMIVRPSRIALMVASVFGTALLVLICGALEALDTENGWNNIVNASWLWITAGALLLFTVAAIVVYIMFHRRASVYLAELTVQEGVSLDRNLKEYFDLPDEMTEVSFFKRYYRGDKNTLMKSSTQGLEFSAFQRDDSVFILYDGTLLKIPVRDCMGAETVESKIYFKDFVQLDNKKQLFKEYGVKTGDNTTYVKVFGRLMFQKDGEVWTIDVLPYSFEPFKKLFSK